MQTELNNGKLIYLQLMFEKEVEDMIGAILKKKNHLQFSDRIHKLHTIDKRLRDNLLKRWITRCKITHSLAFFQWRAEYEPRVNKGDLVEVFEDKINMVIINLEKK